MQSKTDRTVVAVFRNSTDAQSAVSELKSRGISENNIYLSSGNGSAGDISGLENKTAGRYDETSTDTSARHEGGFTGWLKNLFGGETHQDYRGYETAYAGGNAVISVDTDEDHENEVSEVLNRFSPVDVHTDDIGEAEGISTPNTGNAGYQENRSDYRNANEELGRPLTTTGAVGAAAGAVGAAAQASMSGAAGAQRQVGANDSQVIPVLQEDLQVGKRMVQQGGVRVYSRITNQPIEEQVRLRQEHVNVDRKPVNRPATEADFKRGRDEVIEMQEFSEEPVVSKQARVVEEVRLNKQAGERTETVRDSVRRTEVEVENLTGNKTSKQGRVDTADVTGRNPGYDDDFRNNFNSVYGKRGLNYDDYEPAYRYGSDMASDPRYTGRSFSDIENDLRTDYGKRYPNSTWDQMKDSIRYGWDKVTGKARSATTTDR